MLFTMDRNNRMKSLELMSLFSSFHETNIGIHGMVKTRLATPDEICAILKTLN